ncbi:ABC transporter substrate-binding protein (plasmid) [Agrobacterium rosae]|uniref:ABC transporter substrate-binding protein n=1 Tax=Agrobacterium rosae TaxID=1972867 RepID=A0ABU4W481_9HYPH|nr:ABC transporter substrate-binding protein [Agrobacterium rosae]MDX8331786.1 ABC transporter substrate-binding protein [Agrobacterium rosae]
MHTTRRQLLLSGAAGTLLASVPGVLSSPAKAQAGANRITFGFASRSSNSLNPQQVGLSGADNWVVYQIFDRLVTAPNGAWAARPEEFLPGVAESWTTSADAKTWTYKLRPGIKFHKGYGELTAEDVVFSFQRHLDPKIVTNSKVFYTNITRIEAPHPLTVVFTLSYPDPLFNAACQSHVSASILCKKAFEEKGEGFAKDPIGSGAYYFESLDSNNGMVLKAFPEYFDGPAATPTVQFRYLADTTARTLAFAAGDIDMIEGVRAPGWSATMQQQSAQTIFDATAPGSLNSLSFNLNKGPLKDLRVRQAIRYAIDADAIAGAFGGIASPMIGIIASQFPGSVSREELPAELQYKYDPTKATALLAEAGLAKGLTIPCYISQREDYASIMLMVQEQLRAVNINLDLKIIDHATFHSDNRLDKNTLALWSLSYPPVPTQIISDQLAKSFEVKNDGSGGTNFAHYGSVLPGIDDLLQQTIAEPDFDKRVGLVKDIEKQVLKDLPLIGIITLAYVVARNQRVDIGFPITSGPAYWPLRFAKVKQA